jgi:hypothetical protein
MMNIIRGSLIVVSAIALHWINVPSMALEAVAQKTVAQRNHSAGQDEVPSEANPPLRDNQPSEPPSPATDLDLDAQRFPEVPIAPTCPTGQFASAFPDVRPEHWAYEAVNRLAIGPIRCFPR